MSLAPRLADLQLAAGDRRQLAGIQSALHEVLGSALVGAYLHGSAVLGGLHPQSDIDVLAVAAHETTIHDKSRLIDRILALSGRYPSEGPIHPIELTVV